ncbi:MAG: glycosyl transferase family 28 [Muribaculaceae bacterium]|nr:glycosyl transferase family 28 [Muribaculaceae bacterium]
MIFITVGTQEPFDRFLRIIDEIVPELHEEVVVQAFGDRYTPVNFKVREFIEPDEFDEIFRRARLIVSHAGMGTIISAMQCDKAVIVFPRMASLGEHRNDHQMATARQMEKMNYVYVAYTGDELRKLMCSDNLAPLCRIDNSVSESLIDSLCDFIG